MDGSVHCAWRVESVSGLLRKRLLSWALEGEEECTRLTSTSDGTTYAKA